MIFKTKKRKQAVKEYFAYVETEILPFEKQIEVIDGVKRHLKEGIELIDSNEWAIAFENLSSELVEHYIILDRKGIEIVKKVIELCKLDKNWELDLRRIESAGYVMGSWKLVDSEKLAQKNKYTFYKPSREITQKLQAGDIVKMTFEYESTNEDHPLAERMWVQITEVNGDKFKGILDNHPFYLHELYAGDEINFEHKHIIDHNLDISEPNLPSRYYDRCFVTKKVLYENAPINYIYREEPMEKDEERDYEDTGWRILSGDESDEYMDNSDNICLVSLGAVLSLDDSFIDLLDSETGTSFKRSENGRFVKLNKIERS